MSIDENTPPAEGENQQDFWGNGSNPVADVKHFRPIHYIGSKLRVVDEIRDALNDVDPAMGPVCDLFAGSGTVSMSLAGDRRVTSIDIQEYSRTICSALLRPRPIGRDFIDDFLDSSKERAVEIKAAVGELIDYERESVSEALSGDIERLCCLVEGGSIVGRQLNKDTINSADLAGAIDHSLSSLNSELPEHPEDSLVSRYFGGIYFSFTQSAELDSLLSTAYCLPDAFRDVFVAAILSTASSVVNTIGKQFAQPIRPRDSSGKPKRHLVNKILRDREVSVFSTFQKWIDLYKEVTVKCDDNLALRGDFLSTLRSNEQDFSVIYADPPYTRDHYSRFYHVLETMCLRDNPEVSTVRKQGEDRLSRGLYRVERHQSPFCIRSQAPSAFESLFEVVSRKSVPLVLSYSPDTTYKGSRPRVMTLDGIRDIALNFFRSVEFQKAGSISHSKLNHSSKILGESTDAEVLFICRP